MISTVLITISDAPTTFDIISERALLLSNTQSAQLRFISVDMHIQGWITSGADPEIEEGWGGGAYIHTGGRLLRRAPHAVVRARIPF